MEEGMAAKPARIPGFEADINRLIDAFIDKVCFVFTTISFLEVEWIIFGIAAGFAGVASVPLYF